MTRTGLPLAGIDGILALVACEAAALTVWLRRRDASAWLPPALLTLAAGAALLVAFRSASTGSPSWTAALPLALGGLAHAASFWLAFRLVFSRARNGPSGT